MPLLPSALIRRLRPLLAHCGALLLYLCLAATAQAALSLPAEPDRASLPLAGELSLLRDSSGQLDLAAIRQADAEGRFTPLPDNLGAGFSPDTFWLRFRLRGQPGNGNDRWLLEVQPTMLDEITLFVPAGKAYISLLGGDHRPPEQREISYRHTVFRLPQAELASGEEQTFYLPLRSSSTMAAGPVLWSEAAFVEHASREHLLLGLFWGIAGLVLLFCVVIWIWLADRRYLLYGLHLGGILLNQFCANGLGHLLLWSHWPYVNDYLTSYAPAVALASGIWFLCEFTRLSQHFPRLNRLLHGCALFVLLLALPALFGGVRLIAIPYYTLSLLFTLGVPFLLALLWLRRTPETALYVIGFFIFNIGAITLGLRNLGLLPPSYWIDNALQIGTLVYLVLFHLGIVMRIRQAELARHAAQQRELLAAQQSEYELEQKILARTAELSTANATLRQREQELQQAKEQAEQGAATDRQAREEQAQLLALIAHEFRSPLAAIGNTAQSLRRVREVDPLWVQAKGEKIFNAVNRLSNVIDNSLSDARLDSTDRPLQPEPLVLADFLDRLYNTYSHDTLHRWHYTPPSRYLTLDADPGLLDLALSNLLDNACKYAPPGSAIELSANFDGDYAYIDVRDYGPGIAPELQGDIFKKFVRGDTRGQKGTGLGLYLVKRIADMHGGKLTLDSTMGQGATFRLQLPLQANQTQTAGT